MTQRRARPTWRVELQSKWADSETKAIAPITVWSRECATLRDADPVVITWSATPAQTIAAAAGATIAAARLRSTGHVAADWSANLGQAIAAAAGATAAVARKPTPACRRRRTNAYKTQPRRVLVGPELWPCVIWCARSADARPTSSRR